MNTELKRQPNESIDDFRYRLYYLKDNKVVDKTWQELSDIYFLETTLRKTGDSMRKEFAKMKRKGYIEEDNDTESSNIDELNNIILEYKKERVKMTDVMTQTNALVRKIAREESIKEIAHDVAIIMSDKKLLPISDVIVNQNDEAEAILQLSDWHYGMEVETFWNKYSPEICRERVAKLLQETKDFCKLFKVNRLHVVNLSDLICGRIHLSLRLQSRFDVITQVIEISEILAEFISDLTNNGIFVEYYDCLDNHSRLEPNKKDSIELESLVRIIPWYMKERLAHNDNFHININSYDMDIIDFEVMGYKVGGVHGHKDKPGKVVDNLTLLTKNNFDLILTAHLHHFNCDEKTETLVVSNGSLMGTDYYAKDLRLTSAPSQNLILVSKKSVADYIHRVVL